MYAIKLELKLNNKERSYLAGCARYARLSFLKQLAKKKGISRSDLIRQGIKMLIDEW